MNDAGSNIETLLRASAPHVSEPIGLAEHRGRILDEARRRRGRRLRVWIGSAVASVVLIGSASMAVSSDGRVTPWGWVADNIFTTANTDGSVCFQGILVKWDGVAEDDPLVVDAKAFVAGVDLTTLDTTAMEAQIRADNAAAVDDGGNLSPIVQTDAQIKHSAIHIQVAEMLFADLLDRGYELRPGHEVSLSSENTACN